MPIGVAVIATKEAKIATESCEELWTPQVSASDSPDSGAQMLKSTGYSEKLWILILLICRCITTLHPTVAVFLGLSCSLLILFVVFLFGASTTCFLYSTFLAGLIALCTLPFVIITFVRLLVHNYLHIKFLQSPHITQYLSGVDIIGNGSGSHHQLRKLDARLSLMQSATRKCGGLYLYSNHR